MKAEYLTRVAESGGMFVQSEKFILHHQDHYKKNPAKAGAKNFL